METFVFDWWWRSYQFLAREGLRIFRFCVMPWKDEPEPTIKYCLGRQVDVVQEFHHHTELWRQLMVSQWNSSGIFFQNMETPAPSGSVLLALSPSLSEGHPPSVQLWRMEHWRKILKCGNLVKCRTQVRERPENDKFVIDDDVNRTFLEKSRSFLNRVNDRLRKMLNRSPEDSI